MITLRLTAAGVIFFAVFSRNSSGANDPAWQIAVLLAVGVGQIVFAICDCWRRHER